MGCKRGECLSHQGTSDAVDDNIHSSARRDAGDAVNETLG